MTQVDNRVIEALTEVSASPKEESKNFRLSIGATIGFQNVPPMILAKIDEKYPEPPVPMVFDEDKQRSYPNPNHPDYLQAIKDNDAAKGMAMTDALLALGTYLISIDEGVQGPEDNEWAENLEFVTGIVVPKLKVGRWLYWLKFWALQNAEEFRQVVNKGSKALGITEKEVSDAIARFQGDEERGADSERSTEVHS